jgi:hypothetical protein
MPNNDIDFELEISSTDFNAELQINGNFISYNELLDKPKINGVVLEGDKSTEDLLIDIPEPMTIEDVDLIFDEV